MPDPIRVVSQVIAYAGFAGLVAYFSASPGYQYAPENMSIVKLSLSHAADPVVPCVRLTPQELAELAPNMRRLERCERQRLPVSVELDVDGETVVQVEAPASGLWGDGPASIYEKLTLAPGRHRVTARLRDTANTDSWDYTQSADVTLEPGKYFTITFKAETGGFIFR